MAQFVTDLSNDPYHGRITFLIFSRPKIGKTELILKLLREHPDQGVYLISCDKGDTRVRLNPGPYQGRMAIARPTSLKEWRLTVAELEKLVEK